LPLLASSLRYEKSACGRARAQPHYGSARVLPPVKIGGPVKPSELGALVVVDFCRRQVAYRRAVTV